MQFNEFVALALEGELNINLLQAAFGALLDRHMVLRSGFIVSPEGELFVEVQSAPVIVTQLKASQTGAVIPVVCIHSACQ